MFNQYSNTFTLFNNQCLVICGDGLVTIGLEECDDKNDIPYDGCYQCTYQCSEQCSDCQQGVCKDDCKNGLPKVNGICQSICGNLIIEDNEQCDDGNSIQYDGCYFCDYSCPQYCSICEQGRCYECNQNYYYDESQYSCYSVCGDGILTQETEQCDDSNVNSGDGCSNLCQVEEDWICPNNEACIYEKYPEFYAKYYSQKNQYQYVQLEFSQQLKRESDISIEYANFINATILQMDQSKYQISIISVSNATTTLSWISYAIEIYIDQELNDPPYLNIQLLENLYNEYGIKLRNSNKIIQIKIPNYLSKQDILISQNLLEYSEKVVYSLGALAGLLLLGGNGLAFWIALEILQEQSYFKFLNIEYPQNLMIYFESPGFSLGSIYQYFNVEQLPSIYQFRYFESKEKFQFYQINANIIDNMRSLVLSVFILIAVYILTYCAEKFLIVLEKFRQCESNEFITRMFQNLKFRVIKNKYLIRRDGINKIFSINCWDIFFMVFLQLSVYQFEKFLTNQIIALIILFASLLYITLFFKAKSQLQNPEKYLRQRLELYLILKKLLVMYSLVMFQSNYILQLLLICLTNSLYLVSWIFLKSLINIYEYYQTLILQGTLLIFILTTPIYWDLEICKFSYITKLIFGWFHISIFVFVVVFFLIVDAIISLQKFIRLINKYLQIQNDQEKQNSYQKDGPVKFTII